MRFSIHHESVYAYDTAVTFAPHVLRLHPRPDATRVLAQSISVEPPPLGRIERTDAYGNTVSEVTFAATQASRLRITSEVEVETSPPLALFRARTLSLPPLPWSTPWADELTPYRGTSNAETVRAFAANLVSKVGADPIAFLEGLTRAIFDRTDRGIRTEGAAQPAEVTLERRSGACRDVALLFMAACRTQGIAARFVSGYQAREQTPDGRRYLHAWAEVYVEDAGWCGWDAMHGVPAAEGHVALCAAPDQAETMPVEGGFFFTGSVVNSTLDWTLRIAVG